MVGREDSVEWDEIGKVKTSITVNIRHDYLHISMMISADTMEGAREKDHRSISFEPTA
jgi:hypothetical protein